jgi:hypothetical protein
MKILAALVFLSCPVAMAQTAQTGTAPLKTDVVQNGPHKFDVRAKGATCNGRITNNVWGGTDDTAAFVAAIQSVGSSAVEIPPAAAYGSTCSVAPGSLVVPSTKDGWSISGSGYQLTTLQDNTLHPSGALRPVLQVGNDANRLLNATILRDFSIFGAYGGTPSYPDGILSLYPNNLSQLDDLWIQMPTGTNNSFGIKATAGAAGFVEMKFDRVSVFCPNNSAGANNNTGIALESAIGNVDFIDSNIESCHTGLSFSGVGGTPILNWRGGHFERISNEGWGGIAFKIQQASLHAYGVDMESGMTWLDASTVGSEISYGGSSRAWPAAYSDSGIGNRFFGLSGSPTYGVSLSLSGAEQYGTQNLFPDGQFNSCCAQWSGSSGNIRATAFPFNAPGATAGQSMSVVSSASASDYVSTTVNVTPGGENELLALVYFTSGTAPAPTVSVVDSASHRTIYGPLTIKPTMAIPGDNDGWAYALLRAWIPASPSATTWQIQLSPHTANPHQTLIVPYLAINPSKVAMTSAIVQASGGGVANCTKTGPGGAYDAYLQAACHLSGENSGAARADVRWNLQALQKSSGVFLRMHVATDENSGLPACTVNGTLKLIFVPNASMDYNFPLPFYPTSIECTDFFSKASTDPNVMVISQLSVVPW